MIRSQAVLLAIGIGWDGRRSILAVELANRESRSSWRDLLLQLRERWAVRRRVRRLGRPGIKRSWSRLRAPAFGVLLFEVLLNATSMFYHGNAHA